MNINDIWVSNDRNVWEEALYIATKDDGRDDFIETKLSKLNLEYIKNLGVSEFFDFLYNGYFVWKYTAKNRLKTTQNELRKHENNLEELNDIKEELFNFNLSDTDKGLKIAIQIKGLGVAGASGLLALMYPSYFGTVDNMVIRGLLSVEEYRNDEFIKKMNPQNIKIEEAVYLTDIFKKKAVELNRLFGSYNWTPRDIDVILWYFRNKLSI